MAKQIVMPDKSFQRFPVFVSAAENILRERMELINYKAKSTKYECASVRGGVHKSLAGNTFRCRRTESIVSLERGVYSCAELQVFSCYRG